MARILIADDHDLVRDTIAAYLAASGEFTVLTAPDLDGALTCLDDDASVDLALLDYNMPGMNGLRGLEVLRRKHPQVPVTILSGVASRAVATEALALGAQGFIPKSMTAAAMVSAIRFVLAGERFLPVELDSGPGAPQADLLSKRERETLAQLALGASNKQIARTLGVQEATVKLHVKNVLAKLGATNRTQAAMIARDRNLI